MGKAGRENWNVAVDELIDFWRRFDPHKCPSGKKFRYAHSDDRKYLSAETPSLDAKTIPEFLNLKSNKSVKGHLCFNVLPEPYCGDVRNAKVFILQLNPGLGPANFLELEDRSFRTKWQSMIRQEFNSTKFWHLDYSDKNVLHGGYVWWEGRLADTLLRISECHKINYLQAIERVAGVTAGLELVPYHSIGAPAFNASMRSLPSVKAAKKFALAVLERAARKEVEVVVVRKKEEWCRDLPEKFCKDLKYKKEYARGARMSRASPVGKAILRALRETP